MEIKKPDCTEVITSRIVMIVPQWSHRRRYILLGCAGSNRPIDAENTTTLDEAMLRPIAQ